MQEEALLIHSLTPGEGVGVVTWQGHREVYVVLKHQPHAGMFLSDQFGPIKCYRNTARKGGTSRGSLANDPWVSWGSLHCMLLTGADDAALCALAFCARAVPCCAVLPGITESFVHAVLEPAALKAANALLVSAVSVIPSTHLHPTHIHSCPSCVAPCSVFSSLTPCVRNTHPCVRYLPPKCHYRCPCTL